MSYTSGMLIYLLGIPSFIFLFIAIVLFILNKKLKFLVLIAALPAVFFMYILIQNEKKVRSNDSRKIEKAIKLKSDLLSSCKKNGYFPNPDDAGYRLSGMEYSCAENNSCSFIYNLQESKKEAIGEVKDFTNSDGGYFEYEVFLECDETTEE